jgi:hypothetical protein
MAEEARQAAAELRERYAASEWAKRAAELRLEAAPEPEEAPSGAQPAGDTPAPAPTAP